MRLDTILCGNSLDILKTLPNESVNTVVTSPPCYAMRDYGLEPVVWDGDPMCQHNFSSDGAYHDNMRYRAGENTTVGNNLNPEIYTYFLHRGSTKSEMASADKGIITDSKTTSQFCSLCGAWRGSLGLEPRFDDVEIELMELKKDLTHEQLKEIADYFDIDIKTLM